MCQQADLSAGGMLPEAETNRELTPGASQPEFGVGVGVGGLGRVGLLEECCRQRPGTIHVLISRTMQYESASGLSRSRPYT